MLHGCSNKVDDSDFNRGLFGGESPPRSTPPHMIDEVPLLDLPVAVYRDLSLAILRMGGVAHSSRFRQGCKEMTWGAGEHDASSRYCDDQRWMQGSAPDTSIPQSRCTFPGRTMFLFSDVQSHRVQNRVSSLCLSDMLLFAANIDALVT
jgi:hypothetical protein